MISEIYKCAFDQISSLMLSLFNKTFIGGNYPDSWGSGIIVPISKGGDLGDANNDRGITLINVIATFTHRF